GNVIGGLDLDAQVIERTGLPVAGDEDQLHGRFGHREVGVARTNLGRFGAEQLRVEVDGLVEIGHVQGQLHPTHSFLRYRLATVDTLCIVDQSISVNATLRGAPCPAAALTPTGAVLRCSKRRWTRRTRRSWPRCSRPSPTRCASAC